MDETGTKLFIWLVLFWSSLILLTYIFAQDISIITNAELGSMETTSSAASAFTVLWSIMTYQVTTPVGFFISLVLQIIAVMTVFIAYKLIVGR